MSTLIRLIGASSILLTAGALVLPAQALPAQSVVHSAPMAVIRGKPFVNVMVNGRGPFRFIIDTGTGGQAFVTPQLVEELGLPSAGQVRLNDPSGLGGRNAPVVLIQFLHVGGVDFTGVKAIQHPLSSEDGPCQGLLGFTLFRDYLLTLDFPNRRMMLASGALEPDGGNSVLAIRMPDGVPIATIRVGGLQVDALLDSGGDGLSLPEQLAPRLKYAIDPVVFALGQSLSTSFQIKGAKLASDVHFGGYTFERPFVEIHAAFPLANFGSCPMQNFALTFDQKNLLVRFDASRKRFNLSPTPTAIRLANAPDQWPPPPNLVPVG